jgi:hypothetical protein
VAGVNDCLAVARLGVAASFAALRLISPAPCPSASVFGSRTAVELSRYFTWSGVRLGR